MRVVATGMLIAAAMSAAALTWTRPNSPTTQTIALYHCDEPTGTTASNAAGAARALTLETAAMRDTAVTTWWKGVTGFLALSNGYTATCATFALARDWATNDLTISFWLRHHAHGANPAGLPPLDATNTLRCGLDWPHDDGAALQSWWRAAPVASAALTLGAWPAAEMWSADDLDELLIEHACLTDFSDGHVPEPAGILFLLALAGWRGRRQDVACGWPFKAVRLRNSGRPVDGLSRPSDAPALPGIHAQPHAAHPHRSCRHGRCRALYSPLPHTHNASD